MPYQVQTASGTTISIESELIDGNENPKFSYDSRIITATSANVSGAIYNANQSVGSLFTFPNAARKGGMGGIVQTATLICNVGVASNYRLLLFDQSVTTSDHSTNGVSDADLLKLIGIIDFNANNTTTSSFITTSSGLGIIYQTVGTTNKDIYGVLFTTNSVTLTGINATGITIRLGCSLD